MPPFVATKKKVVYSWSETVEDRYHFSFETTLGLCKSLIGSGLLDLLSTSTTVFGRHC
jgi:hypothetical protein